MKKAVLMGVPHHNNLGDHAIVLAEREYIEDNFKEYQYYEVSEETAEKGPEADTQSQQESGEVSVSDEDIADGMDSDMEI